MADTCRALDCAAAAGPHSRTGGSRLCASCLGVLRSRLSRLPALYKACESMLEQRRSGLTERVSGWQPSGIRLDEAVVTVRSDIRKALASWCALAVDERAIDGPRRRDVDRMAAFLGEQLGWLAAHAAIGDLVEEVARLVDAARQVMGPAPGPGAELGVCHRPGCGHVLRVIRSLNGSSQRKVTCDAGHVFEPHQWLLLAGRPGRAKVR
jgi:hypothetical protein